MLSDLIKILERAGYCLKYVDIYFDPQIYKTSLTKMRTKNKIVPQSNKIKLDAKGVKYAFRKKDSVFNLYIINEKIYTTEIPAEITNLIKNYQIEKINESELEFLLFPF